MKENSLYDKKSLKEITGKSADWNEVAKDCVAFSNAQGGIIDYGIEDDAEEPMSDQRVPEELVVTLQNKINGRTSNVNAYGEILTHPNGGQYLRLHIARGSSAASTTSGKFFIRVSDNSVPVIGSDINRISAEKGYYRWEDEPSKWSWKDADAEKLKKVVSLLHQSDRVSDFVKQKDIKELLDYYFLTEEESDKMTYLGVLFKRNEHLANLCYALRLMEREGSGYDKMYEIQLSNGKQVPSIKEGNDSVTATVERRIISKESIKVIQQALQVEELKQKQIICLGLIAQNETITASALIKKLHLRDRDALSPWLNKLVDDGLVEAVGQNRSKEYRVSADILKNSEYKGTTSLKRIENYRIRELIIEDLKIYNCASLMDIHERIGKEISYKKVLAQMKQLVAEGIALPVGQNRWVKYQLNLSRSHFQNRE